tara:strand:+ start:122 stop:724 length:603 start_codon:yes stop_codon:yes gene_type:complete
MADKTNDQAFGYVSTATDNTRVDNIFSEPDRLNITDVHNALMVSGMVPGIGNIADAADALLYTIEGKFGDAALSAASMLPIAGQMVSAKKLLKKAKEAGETTTIYRGMDKWYPGKMVEGDMFIGGGKHAKDDWKKGIWTTTDKQYAIDRFKGKGVLMKFEVPNEYLKEHGMLTAKMGGESKHFFPGGLPTAFLTKMKKGK